MHIRSHGRQQQQPQMIYISSYNSVWLLSPVDIVNQVKQLLSKKEFDLALTLVKMSDESPKDREERERSINKLYAFELFKQRSFKDAMDLFLELHTDPSHVAGLYPNLLPEEFRNQIRYPGDLPVLEGVDIEGGLLCLIEYLTKKRHDLIKKDVNREVATTTLVDGSVTMKPKKQLLQIIDTTLLKCYTNDALVGSLLRLKENNCHLEECERVLKAHNKHADLITLYERKGLHTKGPKNIDLIFEYSEWILKKDPQEGLKIFTEDLDEVRSLPRLPVFNFLEKINQDVLFNYVEHVVNEWSDTTMKLHNYLCTQYITKTSALYYDYINNLPPGVKPTSAGSEPGELGELRRKTIKMLNTSMYYQADLLLKQLPQNILLEERAILCGRLGKHEEVLSIYVLQLQDFAAAERYCENVYDENDESSKQVFFDLLKYYLTPPQSSPTYASTLEPAAAAVPATSSTPSAVPNVEAALHLVETYSSYLDIVKVLDLFPKGTKLFTMFNYIEKVLSAFHGQARHSLIQKNLLKAEHLLATESYMRMRKMRVEMNEDINCKVCNKRIGNSAFARYPNGVIVHCGCIKDVKSCPN
ncbi:hypothetical protein HELRODRAFT_165201 [Helobdella robusta]|uniref:Vacuolar sorting protein 39/Transforming growth factor beta receptor-associated domain-containing protein n=1 Tax=Helobdella robusta TaxID=6412 RepID=T1EWF3_HELRO|nr:hypothetical protein HELRODRAFT_165201 [Helobdella robusta]ESN93044.1 hypothetical protein HELRODRAFT_165201 [Helobdella robusta]